MVGCPAAGCVLLHQKAFPVETVSTVYELAASAPLRLGWAYDIRWVPTIY